MNTVTVSGRLTRDPVVRHGLGERGISVAHYTLAVRRDYKAREGQPDADFVRVTAFRGAAMWVENWLSKGSRVEVTGRIQTGSYEDKDGKTVYTTEIIAASQGFGESMKAAQDRHAAKSVPPQTTGKAKRKQTGKQAHVPDYGDVPLPF